MNARFHRPHCHYPPCPICLTPMPSPDEAVGVLTEARPSRGHLVPEAAGSEGREIVVECSRCNNRFGAWYDSAFASQLQTDRFRSCMLPVDERIDLLNRRGHWLMAFGRRVRAMATRVGEGIALQVHLDGPAPDLSSGLGLAIVDPRTMAVVVSLLHSAYLRLVWHLGYEYVLEPSVQGFRQELLRTVSGTSRRSEHDLEKRLGGYARTMLRQERPESWVDLGVVHSPRVLASFAVFVPGIESRAYTMFLPGFGRGARGLHERMKSADGQRAVVRQIVWEAPREMRLTHPHAKRWGREYWDSEVPTVKAV